MTAVLKDQELPPDEVLRGVSVRLLDSIWDLVHFLGSFDMTVPELAKRFQKKDDTIRSWISTARGKLGIRIYTVPRATETALSCDPFVAKAILDPVIERVKELRNGSGQEAEGSTSGEGA